MIAVLSPAKNLRPVRPAGLVRTRPQFMAQAQELAALLGGYSPWRLESLLRISPSLALRAFEEYQQFAAAPLGAALPSYYGLAYQHLGAGDFTGEDYAFAAAHLRIASALYGLLRPADAVAPHRLEMQSRLLVNGKGLYAYWGDRIYRALFGGGEVVVNLASGEYAKAFLPHLRPGDRVITCRFLVRKRGRLVTPPACAKMARGEMARYLIKNRVATPAGLTAFGWQGYAFAPHLSGEECYTFVSG